MIRLSDLSKLSPAVGPDRALWAVWSLGSTSSDNNTQVVFTARGNQPVLCLLHVLTNTLGPFDSKVLTGKTFTPTTQDGIALIHTYAQVLEASITPEQYLQYMHALIESGASEVDEHGHSPLVRLTIDGMMRGLLRQSATLFLRTGIVGGQPLLDTLRAHHTTLANSPIASLLSVILGRIEGAIEWWDGLAYHEATDEDRTLLINTIIDVATTLALLLQQKQEQERRATLPDAQ
jgi:hypothetical protein